VITASEFHPRECNLFVYSSSKGTPSCGVGGRHCYILEVLYLGVQVMGKL
jgi:hypothetical protein